MSKEQDSLQNPSAASNSNNEQRNPGAKSGDPQKSKPSISLPKGGGAIRGIGEKFGANPVTGTGTMNVPITTSPGRSGFAPQFDLSYDSGAGNGVFGLGWHLSLPAITRKTDKGLPQYLDTVESDVFILSGAEDLVPVLVETPGGWVKQELPNRNINGEDFEIRRYRPRIESSFSRIERWTSQQTGEIHWRSITRDNVTTLYGNDDSSRIFAPAAAGRPKRVFSWLISQSFDDRGNTILYEYAAENDANVDFGEVDERNRVRNANRYLRSVKYGNRLSRFVQPNLSLGQFMFEVVFDYDEGRYEDLPLNIAVPEAEQHRFVRAALDPATPWSNRLDPFSTHRSGFEVRTYRRCHRVLMFHRFPELGAEPCLVASTEFDYADLDYSLPVTVEQELAYEGSTRIRSVMRSVIQSKFVRDESQPVVPINGVNFVTYLKKSLPPLDFTYSQAAIQEEIQTLDGDSFANLPSGLDNSNYQWVDLDGEGISGVLTNQAGALFYKPNLGNGTFGPLTTLPSQPSLVNLQSGKQQLLDLAGDGQLDLVAFSTPTPGFYERTEDHDWQGFKSFPSLPSIPWQEPNLRFIDLTGDGHADVLITEDDVFTWHPSLAEDGFDEARRVSKSLDEERGPRLVFADGTQSIYLADMCGDGLSDLVRIRNGEVCYWPNLGYGHFGAKVTMGNSPRFDTEDEFSQQRIRVADIDGSGVSDIIYLGRNGVRIFFNQSGNRWSDGRELLQFPPIDNLATITTVDLLGKGTVCLVWSSPLPGNVNRPLRFIDLMGTKPHLLVETINNLGGETRVDYASSTKFYLADKAAGKEWVTRIPFPVHVVERVETFDRISGNRFVSRYDYHHGHFDGFEREFRGFGMVEQRDTEEFAALNANQQFPAGANIDESSHVPPVLTRSWFHTGAYLSRDNISNFFAGLRDEFDKGEYYREPGLTDLQAKELLLDDTVLPSGLTVDEEREACRALKGMMLRQEIYAEDNSEKSPHPYVVTEQNFTIQVLQPQGENPHAVMLAHSRETISYHYERESNDPRVTHALTLALDEFGNVRKEASIGYGRRTNVTVVNAQGDPEVISNPALNELDPLDQSKQTEIFITYTEYDFTNPIDDDDDYRARLSSEGRTYELTGLILSPGQKRFTFDEVLTAGTTAAPLSFEAPTTAGSKQKRLVEHVRTIYRADNLSGPLLLHQLQSLAIPFETYKLAFTPGLVTNVYAGRVTNSILEDEARYVHSEGDANWWTPSGREFYSPNPLATPAQELAEARSHFFLAGRYREPFHTSALPAETIVTYDNNDLLLLDTQDALGNRITAGERDAAGNITERAHDYRVLQPFKVMDANRNRVAVAFDAHGLVTGTCLMGKPEVVPQQGDLIDAAFRADLTRSEIDQFFANPKGPLTATLLDKATSRIIYDVDAYWLDPQKKNPVFAATISRETHVSDADPNLKIQVSFSYSDGFAREIQRKIPAETGPVPQRDGGGAIVLNASGQPVMTAADFSPRWVGSGWTIFNNKALPVRQYEPYFTDTHRFEFDVRIGISPIVFHDPTGRVVASLHPNHTWDKVVFDGWKRETWDVSDTVAVVDPKSDPDVGAFFRRLPDSAYLPTWHAQRVGGALGPEEQTAANKTAVHANTPAIEHFDSLGRSFLTVTHNRSKRSDTPPNSPPVEEFFRSRTVFDIEGNQLIVRDSIIQNGDPQGRIVMRYEYDVLGARIRQSSMESGQRLLLNDIAGKLLYAWDSRSQRFRTEYDQLQRPTGSFVATGGGAEVQVGKTFYGETTATPETNNLRSRVVQVFDQAGVVITDSYDFKGNKLTTRRQLAQTYNATLNWLGAVPLEAETFTSVTTYDALNRPVTLTTPDQTILRPVYNDANLLEGISANLRGAANATVFISDIDYDSKGRRTLVDNGNGVRTLYDYDPLTLRLMRLRSSRDPVQFPDDCPQPPPAGFPGCQVQDLRYTYDPRGNVIHIRDDAQQRVFFQNQRVEPSAAYTYDALSRLIEASGREHLGQIGGSPVPSSYNDKPRVGILLSASDGNAMGNYLQRYFYDAVGNIEQLVHLGTSPANAGWTRVFSYAEASLLEPLKRSNRLTSTTIGADTETYSTGGNGYDPHGNMQRMPQLQVMQWDFADQLQMTQRQAVNADDNDGQQHQGERTWYVYNGEGQRVRKVTELAPGQIRDERIYLGGLEIYRRFGANPLTRETFHVMDDKQRVAQVETRTQGNEPGVPETLIRYQLTNHIGSASLELDQQAQLISYEEYYPYGSTSYRTVRNQTETPNRYRYSGKERDEESGLYYHGARYYAPWIIRWTSCDPIALKDGVNLYLYVRCNPIKLTDPSGTLSWWEEKLDAIVNPQNSTAKAVMDNFAKRGEALVNAPTAMKEVYQKEGVVGVGTTMAKGLGHLVKDTGEAMGDVAYAASHLEEQGAKEKLASRSVDVVLGVADIVTIFDGAGAAKGAGTGAVAVAKDVAATMKGGMRSMVTAEGIVVNTGKALAATGKPLEVLGQGAKATGITMMQSSNLANSKGPTPSGGPTGGKPAGPPATPQQLPPVKKIPPGVGKEPLRVKPSEVTVKPKGGAPSAWDEGALAGRGMTPRAAFPKSPLHHLIPQELLKNPAIKRLLKKRKIDIDEFTVRIGEGEHSAVHTMDFNKKWTDFFANNPNASKADIMKFKDKMKTDYKMGGLPEERYVR
ncbi:MAG TPA: SpvB/TcaC N-terminal domain-containing protein [Pyrinomonadaceae bacterium]|nr:SpvB/TcaC N-terminal domain-containing protein [Pyrinomonadaceae bacterium]